MSISTRLEALEEQARRHPPATSGRSRERMTAHLGRVARLRRGELSEEEAAEVRAANAAVERRIAEHRGRVVANGSLRRY